MSSVRRANIERSSGESRVVVGTMSSARRARIDASMGRLVYDLHVWSIWHIFDSFVLFELCTDLLCGHIRYISGGDSGFLA